MRIYGLRYFKVVWGHGPDPLKLLSNYISIDKWSKSNSFWTIFINQQNLLFHSRQAIGNFLIIQSILSSNIETIYILKWVQCKSQTEFRGIFSGIPWNYSAEFSIAIPQNSAEFRLKFCEILQMRFAVISGIPRNYFFIKI